MAKSMARECLWCHWCQQFNWAISTSMDRYEHTHTQTHTEELMIHTLTDNNVTWQLQQTTEKQAR